MQKYKGNKDPEAEAEYIKINMLRQRIRDAQRKVQVSSGNADQGIQAMKPANKNQPTGRYSARNVMQNVDPLEVMKQSFQMLQLNKGVDVEKHREELMSTGPFAELNARHEHHGIQLAQLDSTKMKGNVKEGASTGNSAQDQMMKALEEENKALGIAPPSATVSPNKPIPGLPSTDIESAESRAKRFKAMEDQDKAQQQKDLADQKARNRKLLGL